MLHNSGLGRPAYVAQVIYSHKEQAHLVRLQTTNFRLHDEQTINGIKKITWASVFPLNGSIYIYIYIDIYIYIPIYIQTLIYI